MNIRELKYLIPKLWIYKIKFLFAKPQKNRLKVSRKNIFIFLAADYANLGDVAITIAQHRMLKLCFPDYSIVEIPASFSLEKIKGLTQEIKSDDIITIIGGGNMGDMYWCYELMRQLIVSLFRKNTIISFPQTMYFSSTLLGNNMFTTAKDTYSHKTNLLLMARERYSYDLMCRFFKSQVVLTPDIVLTLKNWNKEKSSQRKVLFMLRSDDEKSMSENTQKKIESVISTLNMDIEYSDTIVYGSNVTIDNKHKYLSELLEKISSASLVVTDRLHGMIFSYISGVPAIVFSNNNYKVKGEYQWIKECGFVRYYDHNSSLSKLHSDIVEILNYNVDYSDLENRRSSFESIIQNSIRQFVNL